MLAVFFSVYCSLALLAIISRQLKFKIAPFCKGLPVAFLVTFLIIVGVRQGLTNPAIYVLIVIGLALGLAGDIFFLDKGRFFKIGIVSFLLGHALYIIAFSFAGMKFSIVPLLPALFYFLVYSFIIFGKLLIKHKKYYPIGIAYLLVLLAMVICAHFVDVKNATMGIRTFFYIGAFMFSLSDGVLTYRIFGNHFRFSDILVLSSYYTAQGIIAYNAMILVGII